MLFRTDHDLAAVREPGMGGEGSGLPGNPDMQFGNEALLREQALQRERRCQAAGTRQAARGDPHGP